MGSAVEYTTIQQQIDSLKQKGLTFDDEENAKGMLQRYGYYNIINSYKEPYQNIVDGKRKYIEGTTFEQIYSMFTLDHNLRNSIMAAMLELEEGLRAAAAEVIAVRFGVDHNEYLKFHNYRDRYSANHNFSFGIQLLLNALMIFKNQQPARIIRNSLERQLSRHLGEYPKDLDILSDCIGISIQIEKYVWVNEKTKIVHAKEFCSGITNAIQRRYTEVAGSEYNFCKRCIKQIQSE